MEKAILHPQGAFPIDKMGEANRVHSVLFQASGWIEPDPFAIRIPSLLDGVVNDLLILEGQPVAKGQVVATLIDEDANLSLLHAIAKYQQSKALEEEISLDIAVLETNMLAADSFYKQRLAIRDEHLDLVRRLNQLPVEQSPGLKPINPKLNSRLSIIWYSNQNSSSRRSAKDKP